MDSVYDRALLEVGQNGIFQKKFDVLYNMVLAILWNMAYMSMYLALVIPLYHCKIPEKPSNISEYEWKSKFSQITSFNHSYMQNKHSDCVVYPNPKESNETKECEEFVYDKTWYESTVATENDWVCSKEIYVANIFAYNKISEIVGSLLFGWFGDVYGRRPTYILALLLIVVGRGISILAGKSYILFALGCIIASFPSWSVVQSASIISLEITSPERRTTTATLKFLSLSCGVCLLSLLYWWLREWKLLLSVITVSLLPYLFLSWNIIESPRWLWIKGRSVESIKYLKKIAKTNKTILGQSMEEELLTVPPTDANVSLGPLALFSSWTLTLNTILQLVLWVSVSISYTVLLIFSGQKEDGNPFLEFAWQAVVEMPGNFLGAWLADHFGRRFAGFSSCIVTTFMWMLLCIREIYINSWISRWWFGALLRTICRLSNSTSYYTINIFNMELYPTCLRQSGMSLGNVFSSGASAIAPYVIYIGRHVDSRLPGAICAGVTLLGVISSFLLPETLNEKLPETLEDARDFGANREKHYLSLLRIKKSTNKNEMSSL